jgi:eukaryotic-like serine/threonine-protein kinase
MAVPESDEAEDDARRPLTSDTELTAPWPMTHGDPGEEPGLRAPSAGPTAVGEGRFELAYQAGAGGMGTVYRALDRVTGAPVAVKLLSGRAPADIARFLREARVLSEIEDAAVVRYVAHGREPQPYLVMEWLEGCDLADLLARRRPAIDESVALIRQIACALIGVHARGIVHRDLKPRNVFLVDERTDRVKLIDFGIARSSHATRVLTLANTALGTPEYMAPEQVRESGSVDARADVFSLGVVLFECLTGRRPFTGTKVVTILAKLLYEETPRIADLCPEVPEALQFLVERMLCKDPAGRPHDAAALCAELDALDGASVPSRRSSGSRASLTTEENRLISVLLVDAIEGREERVDEASRDDLAVAETSATGPRRDVRSAVAATALHYGAQMDWLRDGALVVVFDAGGVATDQAERAALCALAVRALFPDHSLALVMGWRRAGRPSPIGDLLKRAVALLSGAPGAIWIDGLCAGLLDLRFDVASSETGLSLQGPRALAERVPRRVLGKAVPFVGREGELAMLQGAFAAMDSGARALLVTGAPGVGKSRLREELVQWVSGRDEPTTIWIARSDAMRAAAPLGLLGDLVRQAVCFHAGDLLPTRREKLLGRVAQNVDPAQATRVAEFLGEIVGTRFSADDRVELRAARQNPMLMADQTQRAWIDFLTAECRARPVLLVLEDLHWSDRATIHYLDASLRLLRDEPLLVLALARPEVSALFPDLWRGRGVSQVHLGGLSRNACARLARQLLGDDATRDVTDKLWERAAGNPFLVEELVRARGAGRVDDLPETALAMVQSRLLELDPEARRLLRAGSVFGQRFWPGAILALVGAATSPAEIDARLADLEAREWIMRCAESRRAGEREYMFLHDLMREAAYGMLTDDDRRLGNALAGAWLEQSGETDALVLAECFERGAELRRAAIWYRRAAEKAFAGNDLERAIARAERGIACASGEPTLEGAWLGRMYLLEAQVNRWRGKHRDTMELALLAMRALPRGSAPWWEAVSDVATAATTVREPGELEAASRALLAEELGDGPAGADTNEGRDDLPVARAVALARSAIANFQLGNPARGQEILARGELALARCSSDPAATAHVEGARGVAALVEGDVGGYLVRMRASGESFTRIGDHRNACRQSNNVGNAYLQIGGYAAAESALRTAIAEASRLGIAGERYAARVNLGLALGLQGKVAEGAAVEEEELALAAGNPRFELVARTYLARIVLPVDPARAAREIKPICDDPTTPAVFRCYALAVLAAARLAQGEAVEALPSARLAMDLLISLGEIEEGGAYIHVTWAEALAANGDPAAARAAIAEARDQLVAQAAKIADPELRASFLENVPENARTLALALG